MAGTLLSTLTNAETSERGYLLTGEDRYLVPYWAARNALWREFDATEALLRNALGTVSGGFEHLRALAAAKMIVMTDIVVRHRSGDPAGALDLVRSDRGQVLMEAIRVEANGLADIAAAAVAEAGQRALNAAHVAGLGGLGLLVAGLLASGAAARIRRDALRSLTDSEARLRLVQQVGRIAYADRTETGSVLACDEYGRVYGLPLSQSHNSFSEWLAFVHEGDHERIQTETARLLKTGGTGLFTFRIRHDDGTMPWIAMNAEVLLKAGGRVRRVITAHQDVTEIFGACEALARADARFHSIFDSQSQYIGVLTPAGSVVEVNRTALDAVGVVLEAVIGQPFWETAWWPEADRERVRRDIVQAAQGSLVRREAETLSADGRRLWIDLSLKPVRDPDTATVMWIVAEGRDITEQRELANKLAQAQKVEALGQLAGGIAHDFNNILQAVSGAATLIDRRPEDIEKVRRVARMTKDAVARGASITQCLLAFARRGELRVEVLATANLMSNLCEVLTSTLGTLITVRNTVPQDIPSVVADRGQLETVLVNLGTNARDAMPNGGTLTFSASTEYVAPGEQHPAGLKPGAYVRLSVADTGTGMDAATLALATEAFFTTKPPGQGTGLGLPMAKAFAEQGGGAMTMTSIPGVGTTIVLWLCQAANGNTGMAINTPEGRSAGTASARILLVDDDHMVRMTLAEQFEDLGFTTLIASSGAEAIALIEAGEPVNALVTDLSLPTMNGVAVIETVRGLHADLPCFLLTSYAGDPAALSAAADFTLIRKPASAKTSAAYVEAGLESGMTSRGRSDGLTPARRACG